jgi:SPP1 gp7 family putative phage head morphogenesis protein
MDKIVVNSSNKLKRNLTSFYKKLYSDVESELLQLAFKYGNGKEVTISDLNKFNRLQQLKETMANRININYKDVNTLLITEMIETFKTSFYTTVASLEGAATFSLGTIMLNDKIIQKALDNKINKLTLNDRLEKNRKLIIKQTNAAISKNLALGYGIDPMAKDLESLYEGDRNKSIRIARTETTRIFNTAKNEAFIQAKGQGLVFKEKWLATKGDRTRDEHKDLDGTFKNDKGYFVLGRYKAKHPGGFGVASMDINCRCTVAAIFDD